MKSLRSLLSVAVILAFVSPVVTEAKTDINKSPPTITIASQRIPCGSDEAITMSENGVQLSPISPTMSAVIDKLSVATTTHPKMTGSTDGKSVNDPAATLAGTNPFIVLYVTTAVQRTMIPAMKDCSEAIMRAPRKSARSGPEIQRAWRPFAGLELSSSKP